MKLKDIFSDRKTKVFEVTDQDDENELNWILEPTAFALIPFLMRSPAIGVIYLNRQLDYFL